MSRDPSSLHGPGEPERVRWTLDIVQARVGLPELRVLDLACRTGAFATAFADAGAQVLGLEGRQDNLDYVPHSTAQFELADVRDLSLERHGRHDVTLCCGILYHLDAADAVKLLRAMRQVTGQFAVVDTHVGADQGEVTADGRAYRGCVYGEALDHPWSALDNAASWWFTEGSLDDAIHAAGWTQVEHISGRSWSDEAGDRRWLVIS
jgi:SAM-dependent methyltransferase